MLTTTSQALVEYVLAPKILQILFNRSYRKDFEFGLFLLFCFGRRHFKRLFMECSYLLSLRPDCPSLTRPFPVSHQPLFSPRYARLKIFPHPRPTPSWIHYQAKFYSKSKCSPQNNYRSNPLHSTPLLLPSFNARLRLTEEMITHWKFQ